jgi:hypothetical protein
MPDVILRLDFNARVIAAHTASAGHGHIFCLRARARGKSQQIRQFCAGGDFVNYTNPLILLDT